uniref:Uncharacterized protein n=1 Tax=Tanacetum cinerariifolium TaxID=118510 RepID=A0A6L2M888_TANCI|nr:hypothetical protein [Tanacetum cinerariifolium]
MTLEGKKTWWLRLGSEVYDSWKLQGVVEELWDELAKPGLDYVGESWRSVGAWLVFKIDADPGNGDEEITDTAKADAKKTKEVKDDIKKAKLPPSSSSLSISLGFGNQFLNVSSDTSLIDTHIQSPSVLTVHEYVILEPSILLPIPKIPLVPPTTTLLLPPSIFTISHVLLQTTTPIPTPPITTKASPVTTIPDPLPAISQRVSVLEKDVQELKAVDHITTLLTSLRSEIPSAVNAYLGSSLGDALQKVLQKHTEELIQKYPHTVNKEIEKTPTTLAQSSSQARSSLKVAESLSEYELKMILFDKMEKSRSYLTDDKHQALFDALFNSSSLDDAIAYAQADLEKTLRKRDRDDKHPSARPNQEEPVEEPVFEIASDDIEQIVDDVVNDVDQPPNDPTQTEDKALKKD